MPTFYDLMHSALKHGAKQTQAPPGLTEKVRKRLDEIQAAKSQEQTQREQVLESAKSKKQSEAQPIVSKSVKHTRPLPDVPEECETSQKDMSLGE